MFFLLSACKITLFCEKSVEYQWKKCQKSDILLFQQERSGIFPKLIAIFATKLKTL